MRIMLSLATLALLGAAACSQEAARDEAAEANASSATANGAGPSNATAGATARGSAMLPTDAQGFAEAAAASDLFEVRSSTLAREKAASADLRSFAQRLQREHGQSADKLRGIAASAGLTVTPELNAEQQQMMAELEAASGAEFDRTYVQQQRMAHQKALILMQNYRASGDNEALKGFAAEAQSLIETHLDHLNRMPI